MISDYRTGEYPFPLHEIDPRNKDKKWHLHFAQAIYAAWMRDKTSMPHSILNEYSMLRQYGAGKQDPEIYQDILLNEPENASRKADSTEREGWMNLNWDIFSPAPKFKNIVIGMMKNQEHDIVATAIDPTSGDEREQMKWESWFNTQNAAEMAAIKNNLGIKQQGAEGPRTPEEMALFEELGGFKLKKEYAIERGIDYSFYISHWGEIKDKLVNDLVDINICACRDYTDKYTQRAKTRYVDPGKLIIQYSRHRNHRNSEWGGEIIPMRIIDIRALMMNEPEDNRMSEDQLREMAYQYRGINRNPSISNWEVDEIRKEDGSYRYDDFWIDVLDGEVKSVDVKFKQKRRNAQGTELYFDDEYGNIKDSDNRQTKIIKTKTVHRFKWIIGTDKVFDWGYQFDIPRPGKKEVELSFHVYKLEGRSIMSLMQPSLDQIQLNWLNMQNAIAQAAPAGLAVEYSTLQNMVIGGGKMKPLEILTIRRGQGDLVYRATTQRNYTGSGNTGKPIQELQGGIGRGLEEFIRIFDMNFEFLRDLSGINRVADASSPDPDASVAGSEMAISATNNALRPIYTAYVTMKEESCKNLALRLQLAVRHSKEAYNVYYPVLGKSSLQALSIGADVADADYHIKIQAKPTAQMREAIRQAAFESMKPDKDGFTGLEYTDFLMVERLVDAGNLKLAQATISYRSKMNKQRQLQVQRENMGIDAKNQQETNAQKANEERKKKELENELKKDFETHKIDQAIRLEEVKHTNEMEKLAAEALISGSEKQEVKENETAVA